MEAIRVAFAEADQRAMKVRLIVMSPVDARALIEEVAPGSPIQGIKQYCNTRVDVAELWPYGPTLMDEKASMDYFDRRAIFQGLLLKKRRER